MSKAYAEMTTEEIHQFVIAHPDDEEAFIEYHSRLDWKKPPEFSSSEEEAEWFKNLLESRKHKPL